MMWLLVTKIPSLISVKYEPGCSDVKLSASVSDIWERTADDAGSFHHHQREPHHHHHHHHHPQQQQQHLHHPSGRQLGGGAVAAVGTAHLAHRLSLSLRGHSEPKLQRQNTGGRAKWNWGVCRHSMILAAGVNLRQTLEDDKLDPDQFLGSLVRMQSAVRGNAARRKLKGAIMAGHLVCDHSFPSSPPPCLSHTLP